MSLAQTTRVLTAVIRNRALRRVLTAFFIFNAAESGTWVAILVYAYQRGGARTAGLVAMVQLVPSALVAPLGATLGERLRRDTALAIGYSIQGAAAAATAGALAADAAPMVVYACAIVTACSITLTRPAHYAILPALSQTPKELTAANSASTTIEGVALFVGPMTAGLLLDRSGPALVFGAMAAFSMVGAVLSARLPLHEVSDDEAVTPDALVTAAAEGIRELARDPSAALLTALVGAQYVILGLLDVFFPLLSFEVLDMGEGGAGLLAAALGVGGVIGGGATAVLVGRRRLAPAVATGLIMAGLPIVFLGATGVPLFAIGLLIVAGAGKAFFDVAGRTLLQRSVKDEVLTRIFGIQEGLIMVSLAVGAILAPVLVAVFGVRGAFVAAGLLLPVMWLLARGRIQALDAHAIVPGPEMAWLSGAELFAPIAQPALEQLAWHLDTASVGAGVEIILQGDAGDLFYLITQGRVSVDKKGVRVAELGTGDTFGEIALLRDIPRTATVTSLEPTRLLTLDREAFLAAVNLTATSAAHAHRRAAGMMGEEPGGSQDGASDEDPPSQNRNE